MRMGRVTVGVVGLAPVLLLALASGAAADAPTKAGWWNAATANGVALPQPTTSAGDLHVGQGPTSPTAYAAVAYDLTGQAVSAATLELKVVANSAVGTIDVTACPTKDAAWKAGDDQSYDTAPAYACARGIQGVVSTDGTSVSFLLDAGQQLAGTGYSLAIVPSATAVPFSVDFVKPDATSLTPQVDAAPDDQTAPAPEPAAVAPLPPPTGSSGTVPLSAGVAPVTAPLTATAPLQAPVLAAPVVPAPQAAVPPRAVAPAVAAPPAKPLSNRDRYTAGTLLALFAGFLVWAFQQKAPEPRLLGGMARKAGPAAMAVVDAKPRGIGRFATMRTAPARRLV